MVKAQPAQPTLASTPYVNSEPQNRVDKSRSHLKRRRVGSSGYQDIDRDVFKGGLVDEGKGGIVGIAIERENGEDHVAATVRRFVFVQ